MEFVKITTIQNIAEYTILRMGKVWAVQHITHTLMAHFRNFFRNKNQIGSNCLGKSNDLIYY